MNRRTLRALHRRNASPCMECGRLTAGSNWLTGDPMPGVCPSCKAAADAALERRLSALAECHKAIDGAVAKLLPEVCQ